MVYFGSPEDNPEGYSDPFAEYPVDCTMQTGADWMRIMLAASLNGAVVEGVALSGSSEVICKVSNDFASSYAVGRIRYSDRPKMVDSVDVAGTMVAKSTAKFRGIGRAGAFSLAMEDTLWSSTSVQRVRDASFLAASLVAMGSTLENATELASDVLGEDLPESVVSCVVVPLSSAKRDAASTAKNRSMVFLPQYALQPVVWDDNQLQGRLIGGTESYDWGRITGVAKYLGAMNSLVDPRFKEMAEAVGVPYGLVGNHAATITPTPYRVADTWLPISRVLSPFGSAVLNASDIAEAVSDKVRLTILDVSSVQSGDLAEALLSAVAHARLRRVRGGSVLTPATSVLNPITSHAVTPELAANMFIGTDSAYNAFKSSAMKKASNSSATAGKMADLLVQVKLPAPDEDVVNLIVKECAEATITADTFIDATARLARMIGSTEVAQYRVARLRRKLFRTSTGLADRVVIRSSDIPVIKPIVISVAKAVVRGNVGLVVPPAILSNPQAAIKAQATLELIASAKAYLDLATVYWANRYDAQSALARETDVHRSIKYAAASKAFRKVRPEWLLHWRDDYLPADDLDRSYLASSVRNYTRKRSEDQMLIKPMPGESARNYAVRMDRLYNPELPFVDVLEFVTSKLRMLAEDFGCNKVFEAPKEVIATAPVVSASTDFDDLFSALDDILMAEPAAKTAGDVMATWTGNGDASLASADNGYPDFESAFLALGLSCAFDPENTFTRAYFRGAAARAAEADEAGESQVI